VTKDRVAFVVFVVCSILIVYAAGFMTALRNWPPAVAIVTAIGETENLITYWRNDFGIEPTRMLVPSEAPERRHFDIVDRHAMMPGHRLIAGVTTGRTSNIGVTLYDADGAELHYWPVRYDVLVPDGGNPNNVFPHGTVPLRDGSIVVNFDQGETIARIDPCGETLWTTKGKFHHGIDRGPDGALWAWESVPADEADKVDAEFIVELDAATGRPLRRISLLDDIVAQHREFGRFAIHSVEAENGIEYCCDPFHPNDVEVLTPDMAPAFPMFSPGDLLISLRSLNLVAVIDPDSAAVKWAQFGPWHRQHDPDFLPDGRISVLANDMGTGASRIVTIDPATRGVTTVFGDGDADDFYTWRRGRHQMLANGNIMVVETEKGRALEVDRDGRVVWRHDNVYDPARNGLVNEALVLPEGFFDDGAFDSCSAT
jgi:hypothetical protein